MGKHQHGTALLVFSLSAKREMRRKNIFGKRNFVESKPIFDALIQQTKTLAARADIDVVWMDEETQRGSSFSTRIANAFQDLYDAGYDRVVSIGNDSPDLTITILKKAIQALQHQDMVVGPSHDGGVYLLGLHKSVFDKSNFEKLPWQTAKLYKVITKSALQGRLGFKVFQKLSDIDNGSDIHTYASRNLESLLNTIIYKIIASLKVITVIHTRPFLPLRALESVGLRGPPLG